MSLRHKTRRRVSQFALVLLLALGLYTALVIAGGGLGEKPALEFGGPEKTLVLLAHRGATGVAPENSRLSLLSAKQRRYPAVEIDIQQSTDSVFFIFHDRVAETPEGGSDTLSNLPWGELSRIRVVNQRNDSTRAILSLDSAFSEFGETFYWYLDVKRYGYDDAYTAADRLVNLIRKHHLQQRVAIASVHAGLIAYIEWNYPGQLTVLEGVNPSFAWLLNWIPRDIRPDMLGMFHYVFNAEYAGWLRKRHWLNRSVVFHVTEATLPEILQRGARLIMVDDGPYLDSLLAGRQADVLGQNQKE